jgi:hypothetical protein
MKLRSSLARTARRGLRAGIAAAALAAPSLLGLAQGSLAGADALENAAEAFLKKLDADDYSGAWDALHPAYRRLGSFAAWKANITRARSNVGALKSREGASPLRDFTTLVPKLPDGRYILLRYPAHYEKRETLVETVVLGDDNGKWRIAGYAFN